MSEKQFYYEDEENLYEEEVPLPEDVEEDELDELPDDDELDEEDDRWRLFFLELSSVTLSTGGVFGPNADEKVSGPG